MEIRTLIAILIVMAVPVVVFIFILGCALLEKGMGVIDKR